MKIGVNLKLDVSKLDKARFFKGAKGTYCDMTCFIDTENQGQYGDNGVITQASTKEERADKVQLPIVGNVKVFWTGEGKQRQADYSESVPVSTDPGFDYDSIPF